VAQHTKSVGGNGTGGKVIVANFRHYITGKIVYPKKAKAIAFYPRKARKAS
jgi:hypothetical protein